MASQGHTAREGQSGGPSLLTAGPEVFFLLPGRCLILELSCLGPSPCLAVLTSPTPAALHAFHGSHFQAFVPAVPFLEVSFPCASSTRKGKIKHGGGSEKATLRGDM